MSAHVSRIHAGDSRAIVLCATPLQDRTGSSDSTVCIICLLPEKASKRRWRAGLTLNNRLAIRSLDDSKGQCFMSCCTAVSSNLRPINLLASKTVLRGFIATWFFAASPIRRSVSVNPTYDGVVRFPWSFAMISTRSFCHTPTQLQNIQNKSVVRPKGRRPCHKHRAIHLVSAG